MQKYKIILDAGSSNPFETIAFDVERASAEEAVVAAQVRYPNRRILDIQIDDVASHLLRWMDSHLGHDLSSIVVSQTIIGRGVDLAFRHPELQPFAPLVKTLLQIGFAREYQHQSWQGILSSQYYGHVVRQTMGASLKNLPEVQAAIVTAMKHIDDERNRA